MQMSSPRPDKFTLSSHCPGQSSPSLLDGLYVLQLVQPFLVRRGLAIGLAFTLHRSAQLKTVGAAFVDCPEASEVSAVDIYCSYF